MIDKCIKRFGKSLNQKDADFLSEKAEEYKSAGMDEKEASKAALKDLRSVSDKELDDIVSQVEAAGGKVERQDIEPSPMLYSRINQDGEVELLDANQAIKDIDEQMSALDEIINCAYKAV